MYIKSVHNQTSDQSDLLKFVQNQLRLKRSVFRFKSISAQRRLRKNWLHREIFISHADITSTIGWHHRSIFRSVGVIGAVDV